MIQTTASTAKTASVDRHSFGVEVPRWYESCLSKYHDWMDRTVSASAAAVVLALVYRFACAWRNRRRDKTGELEAFEHACEDDLTDKKNP